MKKMFYEGNQIHNFKSGSGSGTVIIYGSVSDFLTNYGSSSGSGSTCQKVTVPTVPVPVPQHWFIFLLKSLKKDQKPPSSFPGSVPDPDLHPDPYVWASRIRIRIR
jgi:hypothetical protein